METIHRLFYAAASDVCFWWRIHTSKQAWLIVRLFAYQTSSCLVVFVWCKCRGASSESVWLAWWNTEDCEAQHSAVSWPWISRSDCASVCCLLFVFFLFVVLQVASLLRVSLFWQPSTFSIVFSVTLYCIFCCHCVKLSVCLSFSLSCPCCHSAKLLLLVAGRNSAHHWISCLLLSLMKTVFFIFS